MSRLERTLAGLRERGEGAFMPFLVIGDPDVAGTLRLAEALTEAGADLLEFGFPFSDPPADGPVIQAADVRALEGGTTPAACFELLRAVGERCRLPMALLVYYNLVLQFGVEAFYRRCAEVGVDAVLVADLPLEHAGETAEAARKAGVAPIFIVGAFTGDERLARVAAAAEGYLYVVARVGITGEQTEVDESLAPTLRRLREATDLPLLAGFGISTPAHVRAVLRAGADGVICGSAIVRRIEQNLDDEEGRLESVRTFASAMKEATRR